MNEKLEGREALSMLYDSGLLKINNNKRLPQTKEKLFLLIWDRYELGYKLIAKELQIKHECVKVYASFLFKIIGELIGERITQSTLRSSVCVFFNPVDASSSLRGILLQENSIRNLLNSLTQENQELLMDYARDNDLSEVEALNAILDKYRKLS